MTTEEYNAKVEELNRLQKEKADKINEYNAKVVELNNLNRVLEQLKVELDNVCSLTSNCINKAKTSSTVVLPALEVALQKTIQLGDFTRELLSAIKDLRERYITIKNMSTASKRLTELDQIYEKNYRFYRKLRRITLGYIIGINSAIISNEALRVEVEKQQLMNSDYWLSYAISSVMLWVNDEKEASDRALAIALDRDEYKTILFMLLTNLRFGRQEAARKWYALFSKNVDIFNLGDEWEFILEAYLNHSFGKDKEFEELVRRDFNNLLIEMKNSYPNYENKVIERTIKYAEAFPYFTDKEYDLLQENCLDYKELLAYLTSAEKNQELAKYYQTVYDNKGNDSALLSENIENTLYDLINKHDDGEWEIQKQIYLNEYIIKSKGNLEQANKMYDMQIVTYEKQKTLYDLIFKFAFADLNAKVDNKIRKFAIGFLIDLLKQGYEKYNEQLKERENKKYRFDIDGCKFEGNETTVDESRDIIVDYYKKNKKAMILKDKTYKTLLILAIVCLIGTIGTVAIVAFAVKHFNVASIIFLAVFASFTIIFGIFAWLRRRKRIGWIEKKMQESLEKLKNVNEKFIEFKNNLTSALNVSALLQEVLDKYKKGE